jgi:hypothetical protein
MIDLKTKHILLILIGILGLSTCTTAQDNDAPITPSPKIQKKKLKDPIDSHWLPNLTGLPTVDEISQLDETVRQALEEETDKQCLAINPQLRMLFFEHFLVIQKMANAQGIYYNEKTAKDWAHVMAMTLKESDGDSTNITDFRGHTYATYEGVSNLKRWQTILTLSAHTKIQLNYQTNFGLTQTSSDRLFVAFKLAKYQKEETAYLEGIDGSTTPHKVLMNTSIAIRRLVWFYQDFAEGRIVQTDKRIHKYDINNPKYAERYQQGLQAAIEYCGTKYMFEEGKQDYEKLKGAFAKVSYCKFGNAIEGYGSNELDEKCFGQLVTLCPALNIDIALITPPQYFQTRNSRPVCEGTFKRLLNKKPNTLKELFKLKKS